MDSFRDLPESGGRPPKLRHGRLESSTGYGPWPQHPWQGVGKRRQMRICIIGAWRSGRANLCGDGPYEIYGGSFVDRSECRSPCKLSGNGRPLSGGLRPPSRSRFSPTIRTLGHPKGLEQTSRNSIPISASVWTDRGSPTPRPFLSLRRCPISKVPPRPFRQPPNGSTRSCNALILSAHGTGSSGASIPTGASGPESTWSRGHPRSVATGVRTSVTPLDKIHRLLYNLSG